MDDEEELQQELEDDSEEMCHHDFMKVIKNSDRTVTFEMCPDCDGSWVEFDRRFFPK